MLYQEAHIENNKIMIDSAKQIDQDTLTNDCWLVQFNGLSACENCENKGTNECGGGQTLAKLQSES